MYKITSDHIHFLSLDNRDEAIRLADSIKGGAYICSNGEMVLIYHYKD
jgi:hypothetical protein